MGVGQRGKREVILGVILLVVILGIGISSYLIPEDLGGSLNQELTGASITSSIPAFEEINPENNNLDSNNDPEINTNSNSDSSWISKILNIFSSESLNSVTGAAVGGSEVDVGIVEPITEPELEEIESEIIVEEPIVEEVPLLENPEENVIDENENVEEEPVIEDIIEETSNSESDNLKDSGMISQLGFGSGGELNIQAACGGGVGCNCGDTLTSARAIDGSDNLTGCDSNALRIGENDIALDCGSKTISGTGAAGSIGISVNGIVNFTMRNCGIARFDRAGVYINYSKGNTFTNLNLSQNKVSGLLLQDVNSSTFDQIIYYNNTRAGITITGNSTDNTFSNSTFQFVSGKSINDTSGSNLNVLQFNNSFGYIKWNKSDIGFQDNISIGTNLFLENNLIGLDSETVKELNISAEIRYYGLNQFTTEPLLYQDGTQCDHTGSCNITSFDSGTLTASVNSFSNYSANISCGTISKNITLVEHISTTSTCFTIDANDFTLDGNGFNITNTESANNGVYNLQFDDVTVKNFGGINNFVESIEFDSTATDGFILNNTITNATSTAIGSDGARTTVANNTVSSGEASNGILIWGTSGALITENVFNLTEGVASIAIRLGGGGDLSKDATITNNVITGNSSSALVSLESGSYRMDFRNNEITRTDGSDYLLVLNDDEGHLENNTFTGTFNSGFPSKPCVYLLGNPGDHNFTNNTINCNNDALLLGTTVEQSNIENNIMTSINNENIDDDSGADDINELMINNTYGKITWNSSDLSHAQNLSVGTNIFLENNNIGFYSIASSQKLNSTAEIEIYGLAYSETPELHKDGIRCDALDTCNVSYDSGKGILFANVSSFSNYTTIQSNSAPTVSTITFNESIIYTNFDLTASSNYTDPDNNSGTLFFEWYVDNVNVYNESVAGVENGSEINVSLNSDNYTKNQKVNVSVYADDGTDNSSTNWSTTLTVENIIPSLNTPSFNESAIYTKDDISANITYQDMDGDSGTVYFLWYVDNVNVHNQTNASISASSEVNSSLNSANYSKDQQVNLSVYANDGTNDSLTVWSTNLTVQNSFSVISSLVLNSTDITTNDSNQNLTSYWVASDSDNDDVYNVTNWYLNGTSVATLNIPFEQINASSTNNSWDYSGNDNAAGEGATSVWNATGGYDGNGAYEFNATSGRELLIPNANFINPKGDFSLSAWAKLDGTDAVILAGRFTSPDGYLLESDNGQRIKATIGNGTDELSVTGGGSWPLNEWFFVTMVFKNSTNNMTLYENAVSQGSITVTPSFAANDFHIGSDKNGGQPWNGTIDQLVLWNISLSVDQILALYDNRTDLIVSAQTSADDNWSTCVTPNDGIEDGLQVCSDNIAINAVSNNAPTVDTPTYDEAQIDTNTDLNANITYNDLDGDSGTVYFLWYVDNVNVHNQTNTSIGSGSIVVSTLNSTNYSKSQFVNLSVYANDTVDNSSLVWYSTLQVANIAPALDTPVISPNTAYTNNDLSTSVTYTDSDADSATVYFLWYLNDTNIYNQTNASIANGTVVVVDLNSNNFTKEDVLNVSVYADDGTSNSSTMWSTEKVIKNTAPTHDSPVLNSSLGTNLTTENLTAYNQSTADIDGDSIKGIYNWKLNGTSFANIIVPFEGINGTTSNNVWDYSGNENNGTGYGAIVWNSTGGYDGKGAYEFDGDNDYLIIENYSFAGTSSFSLSCFVKLNVIPMTDGTDQIVFGGFSTGPGGTSSPLLTFYRSGGNTILQYSSNNSGDEAIDYDIGLAGWTTNEWHHVAITSYYSGAAINSSMFIDGVLGVTSNADFGDFYQGLANLTFGAADQGGITNYLNGTIDDCMIFNRTLTDQQVEAIYLNKTDIIESSELNVGDNWTVEVTPNDGSHDGNPKQSSNLVIVATDQCATLNSDYTLTEDIVTTDGCFVVNASNIIIDGKGYQVSSNASGYGVEVGNFTNVTIKNFGNLLNFSRGVNVGQNGHNLTIYNSTINSTAGNTAVFVSSKEFLLNLSTLDCNCSGDQAATLRAVVTAQSAILTNNNIIATGTHDAVDVGDSDQHQINNNNIYSLVDAALTITSGGTNYILVTNNNLTARTNAVSGGSGNNFTYNNLTSFGLTGFSGVLLDSDNNQFEYNNISSRGYTLSVGNAGDSAESNVFENNLLVSESSSVVYFGNGSDTRFVNDTLIKNSATSNFIELSHGNHTLTNVTFDKNNLSFFPSANASLEIYWYMDVNVSNSNGVGVEGAVVNAYNTSSLVVDNGSTGADGFVYQMLIPEGFLDASGWDLQTPYEFEAVKTNYSGDNVTVNITNLESNNITILLNETVVAASSPCDTLNSDYTLTEDIVTTDGCFVVNASNIVIDGNGYKVSSNGSGYGVEVGNFTNVTIKNFGNLLNFSRGVNNGQNGHNLTIYNSTINSTQGDTAVTVYGDEFLLNSSTLDCNCSSANLGTLYLNEKGVNAEILYNTIIASGTHSAIDVDVSTGHTINNNIIYAYENEALLMDINVAYYFDVSNNNMTASSVVISEGAYSNYTNNTLISTGVGGSSAVLLNDDYNIFDNNNITSVGYAIAVGDGVNTGFGNRFINNILTSETKAVIYFGNGSDNTFVNDTLFKNLATANEIELFHGNNTLTNVTFDKNNLSFSSDSNASLLVQWYIDVNVSNLSGFEIEGASVTAYDINNQSVASGNTNSNGILYQMQIPEGVVDLDGWNLQTPYNFEASKTGYTSINFSANITTLESNNITILLNETAPSICRELTSDYTFTSNVSSNGTCFSIETSHIVVDMAGFYLDGNSSGHAFIIGNASNVTIKDGNILSFNSTILVRGFSYLNITNITILNASGNGINIANVNHSVIERTQIHNLPLGFNASISYNNSIYNNAFNATTQNVIDNGNNSYNTSYACITGYVSIVGRNCTGGNYWSNYQGRDDGSSSAPNDVANDSVGDTRLPYVNNYLISVSTFGDRLPLLYCSEAWSCGAWSSCTGGTKSRTCSDINACSTTLTRPALTTTCSSGGGGGSGGSSVESGASAEDAEDSESSEQSGQNGAEVSPIKKKPKIPLKKVGPINAVIPSKENILKPDEVKKHLVVGVIKREKVSSGTADSETTGTGGSGSDSSRTNLVGKGSQSSLDSGSDTSKKTVAVIDNAYDARRNADLPREVLTMGLTNSADKAIVLVPVAKQESVEDVKPVVIRKIYTGSAGAKAGLTASSMAVSDEMLVASFGGANHVVINPGATEEIELEVSAGVGSSSTETILVSMYASDGETISEEAVLTQKIELSRTVTTYSTVTPSEDDNSIEIVSLIAKQEREGVEETAAEETLIKKDTFGIYDGQYLEISLTDVSKPSVTSIGGKFGFAGNALFGSDTRVLFTDVYGPYDIDEQLTGAAEGKQGFVFAQRFNYDPDLLTGGQYIVNINVYGTGGVISSQSFLLDLDSKQDLHSTVASELAASETAQGTDVARTAITGALIGDVTGAISFAEIATVAYEQTEEAAYIIYEDTIPSRESQIAFGFLLVLVGMCLLAFAFGPARPVLFDTFKGAAEEIQSIRKDLNA